MILLLYRDVPPVLLSSANLFKTIFQSNVVKHLGACPRFGFFACPGAK
uniref:Uncharacterized protein n=1 Tax=Anguilla anguilla TaxID=7936 RepID=A0A0E9VM72_ANGAN